MLSILPLEASEEIDESDTDIVRRILQCAVRCIMVEGIKKEIQSMSSYRVKSVIYMGLGLLGLRWAQRITKIVLSNFQSPLSLSLFKKLKNIKRGVGMMWVKAVRNNMISKDSKNNTNFNTSSN